MVYDWIQTIAGAKNTEYVCPCNCKCVPFFSNQTTKTMANITTNLLNITLTPAELGVLQGAITTIDAGLAPVVQGLTENERTSYFSLDENNKVFTEEALQEATVNGSMLPSAVNVGFLGNDLTLFNQLDGLESQLEGVLRKVRDSKRVVAHEAYAMALTIYTLYRSLAAVGVPGAQQSADRLGERFAQTGGGAPAAGNSGEAPTPPPAPRP